MINPYTILFKIKIKEVSFIKVINMISDKKDIDINNIQDIKIYLKKSDSYSDVLSNFKELAKLFRRYSITSTYLSENVDIVKTTQMLEGLNIFLFVKNKDFDFLKNFCFTRKLKYNIIITIKENDFLKHIEFCEKIETFGDCSIIDDNYYWSYMKNILSEKISKSGNPHVTHQDALKFLESLLINDVSKRHNSICTQIIAKQMSNEPKGRKYDERLDFIHDEESDDDE